MQQIDLNSNIPLETQALSIALDDEYKSLETYGKIIEKFGNIEPFVSIVQSEVRHIEELIFLMQKRNLQIPANPYIGILNAPESLQVAYEMSINAEIKNIALYDDLLQYVQDEQIQDLFFRLQAASYNNHLSALKNALQNYYINQNQQNNNQQAFDKINEYTELMQKIASGKAEPSEIANLFSNANLSFIGGLILGGAATTFLSQMIQDKDNE